MIAVQAARIAVARGRSHLLTGVDLTVRCGEFLALVGPNGAGKSTFLRTCAGVIAPTSGTLELFGRCLADWPRHELAQAIGYLPQEPQCHWPFTVQHLITLGQHRGLGHLGRSPTIDLALVQQMQIQPLLHRRITTLSGGERARVFLTAALAGHPRFLLADEPAASLDPAQQIRMLTTIRKQTPQVTIIAVLHDLNLACRFADRIAILVQGQCVYIDTPQAFQASTIAVSAFGIGFSSGMVGGHQVLVPTEIIE